MNHAVSGFELLGRHVRESSNSIETIAKLVEEDLWRRDSDDETPFLTPGSTCQLMTAIRELSDRVSSLTDEMVQLGEARRPSMRTVQAVRPAQGSAT
ncbi:hypothetical protein [Modicisalibacter radicis]|uniref:hypothetical protein n=1 Tax=Halomonas sp. EAR18 TaxID=2518972 RepID=UPI00109D5587|nr:hypothetical protein [Halomonas sp. EAR18]